MEQHLHWPHLAQMIFDQPHAILPEKLGVILRVLGPRLMLNEAVIEELFPRAGGLVVAQAGDAQKPDQKPYRLTPEGIAVIPIRGTLMKRFSFLSSASGLTTYQGLAKTARQAIEDPAVKAVLFDVDSPGGTTHGCFELTDALYTMRTESGKPVWAIANDLAASAAYALASAADRVFVTGTGGVGSIGVFALHMDQSVLDEKTGVNYTYVFAGEKKTDGNPHQPLSKAAKADIQAEVDREYEIFVGCVARNRGISKQAVRNTEAEVFFGTNALNKLADEVGTFDDALAALTVRINTLTSKTLALPGVMDNNALNAQHHDVTALQHPDAGTLADTADEKGAEDMAKKSETEESKKKQDDEDLDDDDAKKPGEDDDDDDEDEEEAKSKSKSKAKGVTQVSRPNDVAKRIDELCQLAGCRELVGEYIAAGLTEDEVMTKLNERRAKASEQPGPVGSFLSGESTAQGQVSVEQAIRQAHALRAGSNNSLTRYQALERVLLDNPQIYESYMDERDRVIAACPSGRGAMLTEYVLTHQRRYMMQLGLSTAIEDVVRTRAM
jgi:signal peptide peptidase SppA